VGDAPQGSTRLVVRDLGLTWRVFGGQDFVPRRGTDPAAADSRRARRDDLDDVSHLLGHALVLDHAGAEPARPSSASFPGR
jgi:hypothetical protein